ncbi:phosphoglycerate kinase [Patescibacteria group bacterium]|nr:phosphoglycerate kinase [Patescibacteria group bacterium]MBU3999928.1 phosphoglycerate kinase [Patescibacteria group bacterium]MBU4057085.1 phosphoglycerate kinase [Patescibacteria group bacterium]MBU4368566.1 phosphoglycerate kinase [Patescibacteria group bacterium]
MFKTLKDIPQKDLKNKRVLLRADFNVPVGDDRIVDEKEDWRIKAVLPTIKYLIGARAKIIILTHLGRPNGRVEESLRLGPVQDKLTELLDMSVKKIPDCVGRKVKEAIAEMEEGEILMLENLRFHKEEEKNDKNFAGKLAELGDIYINDAFGVSHRAHASTVAITEFLPSYAGLLLQKEIDVLEKILEKSDRPAVALIGGKKTETKLPVINILTEACDYVLVGGAIANEIINTPISKEVAPNVILPINCVIKKGDCLDIGDDSVKEFSKFIRNARTIVWNGPMGEFEKPEFAEGTKGVIEAIDAAYSNGAKVIIGGGETILALQKFAPSFFGYSDGFDKLTAGRMHISTGGGAMLEFLAGEKLPGIEALNK